MTQGGVGGFGRPRTMAWPPDCGVDSVVWGWAAIFGKDAANHSAKRNMLLSRRYVTDKNFVAVHGPILTPDRVFCSCNIGANTGAAVGVLRANLA
jgi:hypothetical protein